MKRRRPHDTYGLFQTNVGSRRAAAAAKKAGITHILLMSGKTSQHLRGLL
jgi:hypothetical protein